MDINLESELPSHADVPGKGMSNLVSETAAKLALQSAEDHLHSRTGRHLKRFSEQLTKKLAINELKKERNKEIFGFAEDKEGDPTKQNNKNTDPFSSVILSMDSAPTPESVNKIDLLDWNQLMVEIRSLDFSYKRNKPFMTDLNMSVPKSAIYGLLGPSGCGKTTLLKMILGLMKAQKGSVKVNGKRPGDPNNNIPGTGVGFMPQELALYQEFTLNEALRYFSRVYGMTDEEIVLRTAFLVDFLDLPDPDRLISQMSGGQKRRVSLSLSLVHNPPLLILDEPTVGTDPILRERIWEHLVVLSKKESTTIIITTHYIEEARKAHVISLMRNGKLLVEHSPQHLLDYFNAPNLEEVFLYMCQNNLDQSQDMPKSYSENISPYAVQERHIQSVDKMDDRNTVTTKPVTTEQRVRNQVNKNYIRLIRNKTLLVFETVLPTICIIIFFLCIGTKPFGLKIAVYNQEYIPSQLRWNPYQILSIDFLKSVDNHTIFFKHFDTKESALDAVKNSNEIYGALIFNQNFTLSLVKRFIDKEKASDKDIDESTISFYADFTDMIITDTITRAMIEAQMHFQRTIISKYIQIKDGNTTAEKQEHILDPIVRFVNPPIYGSLDPQFRNFMCPGIILAVIYVMAMGLTAVSLVVERKEGLMERAIVAGVKQHEILLSQVILQFFIVLIQTTLLLIFTFAVFHVPNQGNFGLIVLIILLQGLTGMCYGLMLSAICSNEHAAIMAALGSFYPYFLLSGIIWPLEGMPYGLRIFSYLLPQTLPIISLRNIMLKGWYLDYPFVYLGFISTVVWLLIFLLIAALILKIRDNPYFIHFFSK